MGTENDQIDDNLAVVPDDELTPEEEAALRGEDFEGGGDDDEGEGEPPLDATPEELAEIAGEGGSKMVPHARFHEVNEENKRLKAELEARTAQPPVDEPPTGPTFDEQIDAKIQQHSELMFSGEEEEAKKVMREILSLQEQKAVSQAVAVVEARTAQRQQQAEFNSVVKSIEESYPQLKAGSPNANVDAINDVVDMRDLYISRGMSPTQALQAASEKVAAMYGFEAPARQAPKTTATTRPGIRENAVAAANQPPRIPGGMGDRALAKEVTLKDIQKMSDKEFENLDPALEKKLRGEA